MYFPKCCLYDPIQCTEQFCKYNLQEVAGTWSMLNLALGQNLVLEFSNV